MDARRARQESGNASDLCRVDRERPGRVDPNAREARQGPAREAGAARELGHAEHDDQSSDQDSRVDLDLQWPATPGPWATVVALATTSLRDHHGCHRESLRPLRSRGASALISAVSNAGDEMCPLWRDSKARAGETRRRSLWRVFVPMTDLLG